MKNTIWEKIKMEQAQLFTPFLEAYFQSYITSHPTIGQALCTFLSDILSNSLIGKDLLKEQFMQALKETPAIEIAFITDLERAFKGDFSCQFYTELFLFSNGYHAICAYRFAHHFYKKGATLISKFIQNRLAQLFNIDIHPAARLGHGIALDHGFGVVIGETAVLGDDLFIFHNVTLGSTGKEDGDRHPKIGSHVVIGTGATLIGNIKVGDHSTIAAGAVVLKDVPSHTVVAGIPAKVKFKDDRSSARK